MFAPRVYTLAASLFIALAAHAADPFEIRDGDRVLLLGDTLLERENSYGTLELRMHEQFPERKFSVRNLSWAGETPRGISRASFDPPEKGFERLKEQIALVKPTVVFLGFGMAASLQEMTDRSRDWTLNPDPARYGAEPMSAGRFKRELAELMDAINSATESTEGNKGKASAPAAPPVSSVPGEVKSAVRFVLLSPIRHEDLRATRPGTPDPAAHNALLAQYSKAIDALAKERGARFVDIGRVSAPIIGGISNGLVTNSGRLPASDNGIHLNELGHRALARAVGGELAWGEKGKRERIKMVPSPLLPAILRKNALWFHRTRPANETYLFGFRKHEQGQNAKEIPQFDPLVEQADAEIDRLKRVPPGKNGSAEPKGGAPGSRGDAPASRGGSAERRGEAPTPSGDATSAALVPPPNAPSAPPRGSAVPPDGSAVPPNRPGAAPISSGGAPAPSGGAPILPTELPLPQFDLGENLEISLWAANPLLVKPTQMNWDALGRLWVCGTAHYPMIAPGEIEKDQIFILEDTDGDGKADKSTAFAGGMLMPTCIVPDLVDLRLPIGDSPAAGSEKTATPAPNRQSLRSACYVGASTELLHFSDTDGDGVADQRRVVFTGFGTEDTHHNVHTLKWGPDGRLYFDQSVYTHTHLETPWGMVRLNAGGVFAYDPGTERVEVFSKGLWNPWGHAIDRAGQHFLTDGAGRDGIAWAFPGAVFAPSEGARQTMPLISPGTYPKFAGLELIHSAHFPDDWQGSAITCDFRAHRVVRFRINDLGTTAGAENAPGKRGEGIGATPSASPVSPAPSGSSVPSAVQKSGYITAEMPDLARTADLTFRPIDVKLGPDGAIYIADWTNPVINHGEVDFRDPRRDKTHGRIWRIAYKGRPLVKWAPPAIATPVRDDSPRGRIFQMRDLAKTPTIANAEKILDLAIQQPSAAGNQSAEADPYYAFAAWRSVNDVADVWVDAVLKGEWRVAAAGAGGSAAGTARERQLEFALRAIEPALAGKVLAQLVSTGKAPLDGSGPWPELIALAGGPKELRALFDAYAGGKVRAEAEARVLSAFVDAARNRNLRPEGDLSGAIGVLSGRGGVSAAALPEAIRAAAVRLLGLWKLTDAMTEVAALARDGKTPQPVRNAAFDALKAYGDASALRLLEEMTRPDFPLGLRRHAMLTIAQTNFQAGFVRAKEVLADITSAEEALQTWRALLAINGAPVAFAHRLPKDLPQSSYAAGLRAAREIGKKGQELVAVLTPLAGTTAQPPPPADFSQLVQETLASGDPAAGEEVYRRAALACTTCHAIGGAGGKVGPELGTIGASAPLDYIIESILNPNAKVKEGYNAVSLTQNDGNVSMGVIVRESANDFVLRTATGQEQTIARELVKQKDNLGSIMPPGLTEPLKPREKLNLYAFLAQLGKKGVYDASQGHIARTWWLSDKAQGEGRKAEGTPVLTNVDGRLPRERVAEALALFPSAQAVFATAKLTAAAPAKTQLLFSGVREAWLDGRPLAVASEPSPAVELAQGEHTLTVKLDPKSPPEVLRAEAAGVRFLTE